MKQQRSLVSLSREVISLLKTHPDEAFTTAEIAAAVGLRGGTAHRLLHEALSSSVEEKIIERVKGNRYRYPRRRAVLTGRLSMMKGGTGIVEVEGEGQRVFIPHNFLSTALDGDRVGIALFAESRKGRDDEEKRLPDGEVVEVIERGRVRIVGTMEKSRGFFFVVPDDSRITRDIYIQKGSTEGARPGEKVVAEITEWSSPELNPEGRVVEVLGKSGEPLVEVRAVARAHSLPLSFPADVLAEVRAIPERIPPEEVRRRRDLRGAVAFTIDPEDAKDFDDAVSIEPLNGGRCLLGVHIADVSYYVKEGTPLDREAYERGTSVYLPNAVVPMLPEKLSNNLCSLRPLEDRLSYSVLMTVTKQGVVESAEIVRSAIRSRRRFSYEEVQRIIESGKGDFAGEISRMRALSEVLHRKRLREGSIDFETAEAKFRFDGEGYPVEILKKVRTDATNLVEEFMLLANKTVAESVERTGRGPAMSPFLYRVHDAPNTEKLRELADFVKRFGFRLHVDGGVNSKALQKLIEQVKGSEVEDLINEIAVRSMAKAVYSPKNIGHYGLGFAHYAQFTSPIRRYPDLIVHRLLVEYGGGMAAVRVRQWMKRLDEICRHSSEMEQNAVEAEREAVRVMQAEYMKRHLGDVFKGVISGVTNYGIYVEITDLLIEGMVHVREMGDDYYVYDEKRYALVGRRRKHEYRLGSPVMVQVVSVDVERHQVKLALAEE